MATTTRSAHNFSPGPGALFREVLERVQREFLSWNGMGFSIVELSHRTPEFRGILEDAKASLRRLVEIPEEDYEILFLQGGATQVFSSLPLNLAAPEDTADYVVNGYWSALAAEEGARHTNVRVVARDETRRGCPDPKTWDLTPGAAYVHYCANETIEGTEYSGYPPIVPTGAPLVCDMSSSFLARPIEVRKYGMIYAGAHKNVGPAGMTVVVIRRDLLSRSDRRPDLPLMLNFKKMSEANSMLNTPPVFGIYFAGLVFRHILEKVGGLRAMRERNEEKARRLYEAIDGSDGFYSGSAKKEHRSRMNVPFALPSPELEAAFLQSAEKEGLLGLRGHPSAGHCRASLYNGVTMEAVEALVGFMKRFRAAHMPLVVK